MHTLLGLITNPLSPVRNIMKAIFDAFVKYPKPDPSVYIPSYGTTGFKAHGSLLHSTMFRCGVLMGVRAIITKKTVGVMVTASHNPEEDNGVKLIDPSGDILEITWEQIAERLCNAEDVDAFKAVLDEVISVFPKKPAGKVLVGMDTRASGYELVNAVMDGVESVGVKCVLLGHVTTPQLHYYVSARNNYDHIDIKVLFPELYYNNLENSFQTLFEANCNEITPLYVDCANGIGAHSMSSVIKRITKDSVNIVLINTGYGRLNYRCGADFVCTSQEFPVGLEDVPEGARCCSLDGDADRIIYFTKRKGKLVLLNGDRIAVLFAMYFKYLTMNVPAQNECKIGIVQTAYSNGGSTSFIRKGMCMDICCTSTGVKYLHQEAKAFDIGIYFESNGHGTALFDPEFIKELEEYEDDNVFVTKLLAAYAMLNQNVGDAISGLLFVECVLSAGLMLDEWVDLYPDLACCQLKADVPDKNAITTCDAERKCVSPDGLQQAIDAIVGSYPKGRAFVRPSGTENCVRIYSEAASPQLARQLAEEVSNKVSALVK